MANGDGLHRECTAQFDDITLTVSTGLAAWASSWKWSRTKQGSTDGFYEHIKAPDKRKVKHGLSQSESKE
jgi:hypothetical protein